MRVLLLHNRYRLPGGEDVVFEAERDLLRAHGHEVEEMVVDNHAIPAHPSPSERLGLALRTIWSPESGRAVREVARRFRPDILHAHNTFPLLSPSVYVAARREGSAVVQTLHNYRLICPSADFLRRGRPCEDCAGRAVAWPGIVHACYRGSRSQTAVVAAMQTAHRVRGTWRTDVDAFIALTGFIRERFAAAGMSVDRIHLKPNFLPVDPGESTAPRSGFLYAGRLEERKGWGTLVETARRLDGVGAIEIRVAGTDVGGGAETGTGAMARSAPAAIRLLGQIDRSTVLKEMGRSTALVAPSLFYEGFPMAVVEALATGTPVIAPRRGALAEIVEHERTGLLFAPGDPADLARTLCWAAEHPARMAEMGRRARAEYVAKYGAEINYSRLMEIYEAARTHRTERGT